MSVELAYRTELAALIDEKGEDAVQLAVIADTIEGMSPKQIAEKLGVRYSLLWTWLNEDEERFTAYQAALKGYADDLAHETRSIADNPSENSAADKLRIETRLKLASRWDRQRYGEQTNVQVGGSVSLISLLASLPRGNEPIDGEFTEITPLSNGESSAGNP